MLFSLNTSNGEGIMSMKVCLQWRLGLLGLSPHLRLRFLQ